MYSLRAICVASNRCSVKTSPMQFRSLGDNLLGEATCEKVPTYVKGTSVAETADLSTPKGVLSAYRAGSCRVDASYRSRDQQSRLPISIPAQ